MSTERKNPFAPECSVPLPYQIGDEYGYIGPNAVWKRNERERHRVRCVNDAYEHLRAHLPTLQQERRLSKVETLKVAIGYISHLQMMISDDSHAYSCECFQYMIQTCFTDDSGDELHKQKKRAKSSKQK